MVATTSTEPKGRLESVQILRGVAALLVVLVHAAQRQDRLGTPAEFLSGFAYLGSIGVDLFFIISGFVMALSMQNYSGTTGALRFLQQRAFRIVPIFWIWSLVFGFVFVLQDSPIKLMSILNTFTFIPLFDLGIYDMPVLAVGWTLAFETSFYVIVALAVACKIPPWSLIPVLIVLAITPVLDQSASVAIRFFFNSIMLEFALGILAYNLWSKGWLRNSVVVAGAIGGAAVIYFLLPDKDDALHLAQPLFNNSLSWVRTLVWGVPCFFFFLAVLKWRPHDNLGTRTLRLLGDASYSIYLTHLILIYGISRSFLPGDIEAVLMIFACAGFGVLVYTGLEKPLIARQRPVRPLLPQKV